MADELAAGRALRSPRHSGALERRGIKSRCEDAKPMKIRYSVGHAARLWLPVLVWAAVIFAFSATPNLRVAQAADVDFVVRKAGHMFVFGVLAVLIWRALAHSDVRRALLWSLALTAAYAATDEFHQSFTAGRHPSPADVVIDSCGALLFLMALTLWLRGWRARVGAPG
jgi:VanZ family protein